MTTNAAKPKPRKSAKTKNRAELSERIVAPVELRASVLDNTTPEENGATGGRARLSFQAIEAAYLKDPMVFGGVNKKASDTVKKWFTLESSDPNEDDPDADIVAKLNAFARRVGLRAVAQQAVLDAILYGDAYVEVVTEKDAGVAETPLTPGRIIELARVVPSTVLPVRIKDRSKDHGKLKAYRQQSGQHIVHLHPTRVERLSYAALGDDQRGLGCVEAAIRTIVAKEKGDNAAGDQLAWYAKGFHTVTIQDATEEELEAAWKTLRAAKSRGTNEFVGTDRHTYKVENPAVVNPEAFYTAFYYNLASALGMPKDVLIGASAGAVTGSETNLRDYYEALDAFLQTKLTPWLEALYARELGVNVEDLPVRIVWNPLYVNEETEAKTRFTNAQALTMGYRDRVITGNEYRKMAFGLDPLPGLDELPKESAAFPGFDDMAPPEESDKAPEDELRELAGDNA